MRLTISFGPSRSPNLRRVLEYARRYAGELHDLGEGRWRCALECTPEDPSSFGRGGRIVGFTQHWKMTDVEVNGHPEVPWVVTSMCFCAQGYARSFGECRDLYAGELAKCRACPMAPVPPVSPPKPVIAEPRRFPPAG